MANKRMHAFKNIKCNKSHSNNKKDRLRFSVPYLTILLFTRCWSNVGRVGGEQKLSLGTGCEKVGTAVHELLHAIGLWHEQVRFAAFTYNNILLEIFGSRLF